MRGAGCGTLPAIVVVTALAACGPTYHTAPRYRFDPREADRVTDAASVHCSEAGVPAGPPTRPFVTDGCSMFPDGAWQHCCVTHDMAYWCGGTEGQRAAADRKLRSCVADAYSDWRGPTLAACMRVGVWMGGQWWLPTYWRWGYGHEYPRGHVGGR